jgi:hypothetical protein
MKQQTVSQGRDAASDVNRPMLLDLGLELFGLFNETFKHRLKARLFNGSRFPLLGRRFLIGHHLVGQFHVLLQ